MKSETKFALTSEAGLNDGVAFPFTWLAITIGLMVTGKESSFLEWFAFDVIYRIVAGIVIGFLSSKGIGILLFRVSKKILDPKNQRWSGGGCCYFTSLRDNRNCSWLWVYCSFYLQSH